MTQVKRRKVWRISCDVGEVTEMLENGQSSQLQSQQSSFSNLSVTSPTSQLILQPFRRYLSHSSFSNRSVASTTSQFILQPFFRFSYVTRSSLNSPGEPPMLISPPKKRWALKNTNSGHIALRFPSYNVDVSLIQHCIFSQLFLFTFLRQTKLLMYFCRSDVHSTTH